MRAYAWTARLATWALALSVFGQASNQLTAVSPNEAGVADYPWYWTSTTHASEGASPGAQAAFVCFGRALGHMNGAWLDVHGAGCQRSDPKGGSLADWTYTPYGYYSSRAPQGDAVRLFNFARCVRGGASEPQADADADGLSDWYEFSYAGSATGMDPEADTDGDGARNGAEQAAGTDPDRGRVGPPDHASRRGTGGRRAPLVERVGKTLHDPPVDELGGGRLYDGGGLGGRRHAAGQRPHGRRVKRGERLLSDRRGALSVSLFRQDGQRHILTPPEV